MFKHMILNKNILRDNRFYLLVTVNKHMAQRV